MTLISKLKSIFCFVTVFFLASSASAHWELDNNSSTLSFVTVKADHVGEVHTFDQLSGDINDDGSVQITIELASVNTLIDIRNERMQNMLFETNLFPQATISGEIDLDAVAAMDAGVSQAISVDFDLAIHGESSSYTADVLVTRTESGVLASTVKPIIVMADTHGLVSGVEALREVAGLPSISRAVPVSFNVVFEQGH
jgi:polyisoprenoid-binding protein YceI|tara:strand:+ start:206 stop:799 length:594 start_codon:yes stop_codon:yes gene_type:complete